MKLPLKPLLTSASLFAFGLVSIAQDPILLFRDDFNQQDNGAPTIVDSTQWRLPFGSEGTFVGRTAYRGDSAVDLPLQGVADAAASDGLVTEVHLDTYSPLDPGNAFLGTDLLTKRDFALGGGLTFEGRARLKPTATTGGIVGGLFLFDVTRTVSDQEVRDEIDFELLGNQAGGTNDILLNVFDDAPFVGPGSGGNPTLNDVGGLDLTQYNDYKVEWTPSSVKWFVNDTLVRTETDPQFVPDDPQKLHFNIWAPDSGFSDAFNAALQPTAVEAENQRYTAQLDWVEVTRINTDVSENLLTDPSFENTFNPALIAPNETRTGEWLTFNNAFIEDNTGDPPAATGDAFAKMFGPFRGATDASGVVQQVAAVEGEEFEVSAKVLTPTSDSILGNNNFTTVALSFVDDNGAVLETAPFVPAEGSEFPLLDGRDPNAPADIYIEGTAAAKAPAGTAFARVSLFFIQLVDDNGGPDPGAAFFDDIELVRLTAVEDPFLLGDADQNGQVDGNDLLAVQSQFGNTGATPLLGDADGNGQVDGNDLLAVQSNFGATAAAAATPEPAAAVLAALALGLVAGRRR